MGADVPNDPSQSPMAIDDGKGVNGQGVGSAGSERSNLFGGGEGAGAFVVDPPYFHASNPTVPLGGSIFRGGEPMIIGASTGYAATPLARVLVATRPENLDPSTLKRLLAFKASRSFFWAVICDLILLVASILLFEDRWGFLAIALGLFGAAGLYSAKTYSVEVSWFVYIFYCCSVLALRTVVAVLYAIDGYVLEMSFQIFEVLVQCWFLYVAIEFRRRVRALTFEELIALREESRHPHSVVYNGTRSGSELVILGTATVYQPTPELATRREP